MPMQYNSAEEQMQNQPAELFPGDEGTLPEQARRVLVSLLRNSYISDERNAEGWSYLIEYKQSIKSALNDLFLELFVDERNSIAYCLPVEAPSSEFPKLKREHELTEIQSLLIVFLRQQYLSQISGGAQNAWVDGSDMREHLSRLFSDGIVNHVTSGKTIDSAIEYMRKNRYLELMRGANDRYRILPVIETAFPLEKISALLEAYEKAAEGEGAGAGAAAGGVADAASAGGAGAGAAAGGAAGAGARVGADAAGAADASVTEGGEQRGW